MELRLWNTPCNFGGDPDQCSRSQPKRSVLDLIRIKPCGNMKSPIALVIIIIIIIVITIIIIIIIIFVILFFFPLSALLVLVSQSRSGKQPASWGSWLLLPSLPYESITLLTILAVASSTLFWSKPGSRFVHPTFPSKVDHFYTFFEFWMWVVWKSCDFMRKKLC